MSIPSPGNGFLVPISPRARSAKVRATFALTPAISTVSTKPLGIALDKRFQFLKRQTAHLGNLPRYFFDGRAFSFIFNRSIRLQEQHLGWNLLNELAIIYRMVVENRRSYRNKTIQRGHIAKQSARARETVKQKCRNNSNMATAFGNHLPPAFRTVQNHTPSKPGGKFKLRNKSLTHNWRNFAIFQPIHSDFTNAKILISSQTRRKFREPINGDRPHFESFPRMDADKINSYHEPPR